MAYIKVIEHEEAEGRIREIYDDIVKKRGRLSEVLKIQSLNPEALVKHLDMYMELLYGRSPLKRYQRELLAVVVSCANNCEYCQRHHSEAVNHYWKDAEKAEQLCRDYTQLDLSETDRAFCDYAWHLTRSPGTSKHEQYINKLKALGIGDRAILDATQVIAYFNFVNRMVLGLGVQLEEHGGAGYIYDFGPKEDA